MKRILSLLCALLLLGGAFAETVEATPTIEILLVTPTPLPMSKPIEREEMTISLPDDFHLLDDESFAAYDAALREDYPDAARTLLAAVNADASAAISVTILDSTQSALEGAQDAAGQILGKADSVVEKEYGENRFAAFACAISGQTYRLYFASNGSQQLIVGISGMSDSAIAATLASLLF